MSLYRVVKGQNSEPPFKFVCDAQSFSMNFNTCQALSYFFHFIFILLLRINLIRIFCICPTYDMTLIFQSIVTTNIIFDMDFARWTKSVSNAEHSCTNDREKSVSKKMINSFYSMSWSFIGLSPHSDVMDCRMSFPVLSLRCCWLAPPPEPQSFHDVTELTASIYLCRNQSYTFFPLTPFVCSVCTYICFCSFHIFWVCENFCVTQIILFKHNK